MNNDRQDQKPSTFLSVSRRDLLGLGGALLVGGSIAAALRHMNRREAGLTASVFVGRAEHYDADLAGVVMDGLKSLGITRQETQGKRILLKPNLVETAVGKPHINTHPAVIVAVAEAFRRLDAKEVLVGEGQGHRRDSLLVLDESGVGEALQEAHIPFVDLNHDAVEAVKNNSRLTTLDPLYLPRTLLDADWVVSLPKLKTHHWAGVTCSMKNLFGVMPGVIYGWPKNVLHYHGINQSILDIVATVKPTLAIVDAIVGMEGDGPIMGSPKDVGCLIMGRNPVAVDATATRLMGLNPYGVDYLVRASGTLGPVHEQNIKQVGESIARFQTRFDVPDFPHLNRLKFT